MITLTILISQRLQKLDKEALNPLIPFEGKRLYLEVIDYPCAINIEVQKGMLIFSDNPSGWDLHIKGKAFDLCKLCFTKTPGPNAFYGNQIQIIGNVTFLQAMHRVLKLFEPDLEEILSKGVGDIGAVTVTRLFKHAKDLIKDWSKDRVLDFKEYKHHQTFDTIKEKFKEPMDEIIP